MADNAATVLDQRRAVRPAAAAGSRRQLRDALDLHDVGGSGGGVLGRDQHADRSRCSTPTASTGLDFSATVSYQMARDVTGVSLTGPATTPTGATSLSLATLPVGNLVIQRASPTQSAGVDEISAHRISHRTHLRRTASPSHRISIAPDLRRTASPTHRIAAALSTHRIGGDGLLAGNDLGALLGNASLASLTLLRDPAAGPRSCSGTDLEHALPQNTTFAQALHVSRDPRAHRSRPATPTRPAIR